MDAAGMDEEPVRLTAWVHGRVQGVGFRWFTRTQAMALGLTGSAANLADGRVEVVAEGSKQQCEALLDALRGRQAPGHVREVVVRWSAAQGRHAGFSER